jgi:N-acetylmuramoyl-L-alanine amidase
MKMIVVLDPGHDKATAGKRSPDGSLLEYEFNQVVVDLAEQILVKHGVKVVKTKTMDFSCGSSSASVQNADLTRRTNLANRLMADLFVSVHANAHTPWSSARGFEVFNYPGSKTGRAAAELVMKYVYPRLNSKFKVPNRGRKEANYAVVRETKMPAVLIEYEFFTNREGCALLKRADFRLECAIGLSQMVLAHFGKSTNIDSPTTPKPVASKPSVTVPSSGKTHTVVKGETLWGISRDYNTTVTEIKKLNGLTSDKLLTGQKLKIPAVEKPKTTAPSVKNITHYVDAKETLWGISQHYGTTVGAIKATNGLKSDVIHKGDKLTIPATKNQKDSTVVKPDPAPVPKVESKPVESKPFVITGGTPILGQPVLTAAQLDAFVRRVNSKAPNVAEYFVNIGKEWGIRGDIAFLQAVKETGYFRYGGDVKPEQNNFCGLGAVGGGAGGASFATPRQGVIAQLQHLWAYATKNPLPKSEPLIDPRFNLVTKGSVTTWEGLAGRWAVPGYDKKKYSSLEDAYNKKATYGQEILALYAEASKIKVSEKIVNREDGSDSQNPVTRSTTQETVLNTVAELNGKTLKAAVIDGNGYVDASDIASAFGLKALWDKEEQKVVFVSLSDLK